MRPWIHGESAGWLCYKKKLEYLNLNRTRVSFRLSSVHATDSFVLFAALPSEYLK